MKWLPKIISAATFGMLFLALAACNSTNSESEQKDVVLDLETLEAETEFGTLEARRAQTSYVGLIDEVQAIGIAFLEGEGAGDEEEDIVVYLYDGDRVALLLGNVDSEGAATLGSEDGSDFDATAELTIEEDVVSGTASFLGQESVSFIAEAAAGVAGVYWASGTDQNPDVSADWVVLPDGRQWGCVCVPPFGMACCTLQF